MGVSQSSLVIEAARLHASARVFRPLSTVKCEGAPAFRSQMARDVGCLLDMNPDVSSWVCMPRGLSLNSRLHIPDFAVAAVNGSLTLVDADDDRAAPEQTELAAAAMSAGFGYRRFGANEVYEGFRLANARDLLRYGNYQASLGDRVRLLAALDEHGTLTVTECMMAIREGNPMGSLACMILRDFIQLDLDEALIGPETVVRRIAR